MQPAAARSCSSVLDQTRAGLRERRVVVAEDLDTSRKTHPRRLLCVDDHQGLLSILRDLLETFGYSVLTASSGREAIKLLDENCMDLVIVDYEMPDMNGSALAEAIKDATPELPVLMFSGCISKPDLDELQYVDCFVPKGQMTELLLLEVARLLSSQIPKLRRSLSSAHQT